MARSFADLTGSYMRVSIPDDYIIVLLIAAAIAFQCLLTGLVPGGARGKIFTKDRLMAKFGKEHQKYFKEEMSKGGYPDHGSGLYSD